MYMIFRILASVYIAGKLYIIFQVYILVVVSFELYMVPMFAAAIILYEFLARWVGFKSFETWFLNGTFYCDYTGLVHVTCTRDLYT